MHDTRKISKKKNVILKNVLIQEIPVRGLYPRAALPAHDCIGNTFITLDASMTMRIYSSRDIRAGETIYNNYTSAIFVIFFFFCIQINENY